MSHINRLKSDIVSALPYMSTGLVATLPVEMPFWAMLSSIVGLGFFVSKLRQLKQNRYHTQLSDLALFHSQDIQLNGDEYVLSPVLAKKWGLSLTTVPCCIPDETYNLIGDNIHQMYVSFFSQYNIEKNMTPKQASLRAVNDIFKCICNQKSMKKMFQGCIIPDNQIQMIGCYHLARLYQDIKNCQFDEEIVDMFHQIYHYFTGTSSDYKLSRLFPCGSDIQFVVNQPVRQNPMVTHFRGLMLASTMLGCATIGSFAYDTYQQDNSYNNTKYLGLTALGMAGLLGYRRRKHFINELKRFDTDAFSAETIEPVMQTTEGPAKIYHEKVTVLAPAQKLRMVMEKNNDLLSIIQENNVTTMPQLRSCVQAERKTTPKKQARDEAVKNCLKSGYTLEDVVQFYGPERASDSLVHLCTERGLFINMLSSFPNYEEQLKQRQVMFVQHWNHLKNLEEQIDVPVSYQSFANTKNTVFTIDRKVVLVHDVNPHLHDILVHTRS